jgi:hypothetical protein
MAQDWLNSGSTVIDNPKPMPDGSVVFNLPPSAADVAKEDREARRIALAEKADARAEALANAPDRQLTPAQKAVDSKFATSYVEWAVDGGRSDAAKGRAQLSETLANLRSGADLTGPITGNVPGVIQQFTNPQAIETKEAVEEVVQRNLRLILGAQFTEKEGERLIARAYNPRLSEAENAKRVGRLLKQMELAAQSKDAAAQYYEENGTLAGWQGQLATMAELESSIDDPLLDDAAPTSPLATTSEGQPTKISGTSDTFLTPEDQALQGELSSAYNAGASFDQLKAIADKYNRALPFTSQEELDAGRSAGRAINVQPSGVRSAASQLIGGVADSSVGAAFIGAANALASGGLDEIAGAIGADAATVQAAKEMLRERYPISSFAGEVAGQAGQLAVGGAGLRAVGIGAKGLAGAEIAQGAAYGAGESNDNRLGGAAIGAGGAFVGQQLAQKLLNPAAKQAMDRVAKETGAPVAEVERAVAEAFEGAARQTPTPPAGMVDDLAAPPLTPEAQAELGTIAQQALQRGKTGRDAQAKLAVMAQVDPGAKAAAERLGIELPIDVLSNDARLLTVTGLARSQIGSDAQAAWGQTVSQAVQKSDDTLRAVGATNDLAQVSDDIRERLLKDMGDLETQANGLRSQVNDAINVQDRVDASSLQAQLAQTINDLGGIDEAKQAFSAEEKKLLAMLGEGETANRPTYARLNQIRDQIGRALFKGQGPWVDAPTATLKRYYGALADDQIAYVESVGGKELADKMRGSNDLYSQMFKSRESMQTVYGKSLERDIGPLINRAITSGSKGDAQVLRKLVAAVPEDMQSRALLSGIFAQVDRGSAQGGFSFAKYANVYQGLRKNSPIYAEIAKTVGPDGERILRDL